MDERKKRNRPPQSLRRRLTRELRYPPSQSPQVWHCRPRIQIQPRYPKQITHPYSRSPNGSSSFKQYPRRRDNIDADEARTLEEKRRTTSLVINKLQNLTPEDKSKSMKQLLVDPFENRSVSQPTPQVREKEKERVAHVKKPPRPTPAPKQSKLVPVCYQVNQDASHQEQIKRKVFEDLLKRPIVDLKRMATHAKSEDRLFLSQLLRKTKKECSEAMRSLAECKLQNKMPTTECRVFTELENLVDADIAVNVRNMPVETIQFFQRVFDLELEEDPYGMENSTDDDDDEQKDVIEHQQGHVATTVQPSAVPASSPIRDAKAIELLKPHNSNDIITCVNAPEVISVNNQLAKDKKQSSQNSFKGAIEKLKSSSTRRKQVQSLNIGSVLTSINVVRFPNQPDLVEESMKASMVCSHGEDETFVSTSMRTNPAKANKSASTSVTSKAVQPLMPMVVEPQSQLHRLDNIPSQAFGTAKISDIEINFKDHGDKTVSCEDETFISTSMRTSPAKGNRSASTSVTSKAVQPLIPMVVEPQSQLHRLDNMPAQAFAMANISDVESNSRDHGDKAVLRPEKPAVPVLTKILGKKSELTEKAITAQRKSRDYSVNSIASKQSNSDSVFCAEKAPIVGKRSVMTQTLKGKYKKTQTPKDWKIPRLEMSNEDGVMDCTVASSCDQISGNCNSIGDPAVNSSPNGGFVETSIAQEFQSFIADVRNLPQRCELRKRVANHMIHVMTSSFQSYFSLFKEAESMATNPINACQGTSFVQTITELVQPIQESNNQHLMDVVTDKLNNDALLQCNELGGASAGVTSTSTFFPCEPKQNIKKDNATSSPFESESET